MKGGGLKILGDLKVLQGNGFQKSQILGDFSSQWEIYYVWMSVMWQYCSETQSIWIGFIPNILFRVYYKSTFSSASIQRWLLSRIWCNISPSTRYSRPCGWGFSLLIRLILTPSGSKQALRVTLSHSRAVQNWQTKYT